MWVLNDLQGIEIRSALLIFTFLANFILATIVLFKNYKNKVNIYFSVFVYALAGWAISHAFLILTTDLIRGLFYIKFAYISAWFIAVFFLLFVIYFPYQPISITKLQKSIFAIISMVILLIIIWPNTLLVEVVRENGVKDIIFNKIGQTIFTIYYLLIFALIFYFQILKYVTSRGILKIQVSYVLIGTGIAAIFGLVLSLILPQFGNNQYISMGPYFTLFVVAYVFRLLVRNKY